MNKPILDACCGGKMFYFDKHDPNVLFQDIRQVSTTLCDGRKFEVNPDVVADFTSMPYPDNSFRMVVFDPPRIQAKFDDNFAVCNGYPDVATMVEQTVGLGTMLIMFGGVPDWIDVDRQGQFMFVGAYNNLNLN